MNTYTQHLLCNLDSFAGLCKFSLGSFSSGISNESSCISFLNHFWNITCHVQRLCEDHFLPRWQMMSALVFLSCRVPDTLGAIVVPSVSHNRPCSHHVQSSSVITGPFLSLRIIIRLSHPSSSAWTISLVSDASIASNPREWATKALTMLMIMAGLLSENKMAKCR